MEITVRDCRPSDHASLPGLFRDAYDSLRESKGGTHPDAEVDEMAAWPDSRILSMLVGGSHILVAEVKGKGTLAGMGSFTVRPHDRLIGSTYSRNFYVRMEFQHGKAGVSVGSLLRREALAQARKMGFRKMYGFSTPEAVRFHSKFGAVFHPQHDTAYLHGKVRVRYYEIPLRPSPLNSIRIEPFVYHAGRAFTSLLERLRGNKA